MRRILAKLSSPWKWLVNTPDGGYSWFGAVWRSIANGGSLTQSGNEWGYKTYNGEGAVFNFGVNRGGGGAGNWNTASWSNFLYGKGTLGVKYDGNGYFGTNWTGPGSDTEHPRDLLRRGLNYKDEMDRGSFKHDLTYFERGASGVQGALFNTDPKVIAADAKLANTAWDILQRYEKGGIDSVTLKPISPRTATEAVLVHFAFSTIVKSKKLDSKLGF